MQTISSKDNPKLKAVRALVRSKKDRQAASAFVMEGVRALSALTDGTALPCYTLREVWVSDKVDAASSAPFSAAGIPLFQISHDILEQLSDCRTSQGILGVVDYTPSPLDIHPDRGNYLLLDGLMDPGNMGTLIRSAVAFGFDGVLLHGDCVEVFNPKTVRASMGALPFCRFQKVEADGVGAQKPFQTSEPKQGAGSAGFQGLETFKYDLIATVLHGGETLHKMTFGPKNVLVIGNEANGVSAAVQARASRTLSIPMSGNVESLNAAVAGSICMCSMQKS
jgi:TrmH family RNA methyltransferase